MIFEKGDKVVWLCKNHRDYGKIFTVTHSYNHSNYISVHVEESTAVYNGKYFVLEVVWKSKLAKVLD